MNTTDTTTTTGTAGRFDFFQVLQQVHIAMHTGVAAKDVMHHSAALLHALSFVDDDHELDTIDPTAYALVEPLAYTADGPQDLIDYGTLLHFSIIARRPALIAKLAIRLHARLEALLLP